MFTATKSTMGLERLTVHRVTVECTEPEESKFEPEKSGKSESESPKLDLPNSEKSPSKQNLMRLKTLSQKSRLSPKIKETALALPLPSTPHIRGKSPEIENLVDTS